MKKRNKYLTFVTAVSTLLLTVVTLKCSGADDVFGFSALKRSTTKTADYRLCLYGTSSHTHSSSQYPNNQITTDEINTGKFVRSTDYGNGIEFVVSKTAEFDPDGDLLGFNTGDYFYNTTPLNGIYKIDYKWKQYDMYIDFGYEPITYSKDQVGDETHLPETVIKRVKINGNTADRKAKSGIFEDESFFDGEDFNYIRFQSIDSDGGINWLKGIDIYYSCQAVTHFKHVDQVNPERGGEGAAEHYVDYEGNLYDLNKQPTTAKSLVIKSDPKHFAEATDLTIKLDSAISTTDTIYIDYKFVNGTADSKIAFALLGDKENGTDWDNFLGYFNVYSDHVDSYNGVSFEFITDDGYTRIKVDMNAVNKVTGTKPGAINALYVRGGWSNVEGYIEFNPQVAAHTKGATLIPAKAVGPHGVDGYQAHYECTGCDDYWFNESGALCKKEDLIIKSNVVKYAPPASGNTFAEFKNLGNITDKVSVDIHFDNPTVHQEVGFNFYESAWDNYYGTFWVDCDDKGVYFEDDYEGITLDELTDGWWRVTAYPSALNKFVQDKKDIDQKRSIDFIYIKGPGTVSNRGSGMFELNSAFEGTVPSTKVYSLNGGDKYTIDRTFLKGEIINLDFKIKNNTKINFALLTGWNSCFTFNVKPDGTLEDQKNGVQIFKLNNELAGYPTLEGTWYRVIIDTNYIEASPDFVTINRIGGNKWNGAEFDMMINSPYTTDGWYTIAGGSSNTKIQFKIPTPLAIRDGDGQLFNKALYFEVKAVGSGKAYVSPMDYDWHNCGKYVLTFTDGALTDRVVQGSANKWPKVTDLGNGVYGLTLALSQLPGDGLASASSIGFFYNGEGVLANGLSEFSINVLSLKLVEIPA